MEIRCSASGIPHPRLSAVGGDTRPDTDPNYELLIQRRVQRVKA